MRISEMSIRNWNIDPEFDEHEARMMSKWTGYEKEKKHWPDVDKAAIRDPAVVERLRTAFKNTTHDFSIYFYQSSIEDYDNTLSHGSVDAEWMRRHLEDGVADRIMAQISPQDINIVMTNNLSDFNNISVRSPWMLAHRISHAMLDGKTNSPGYQIRHEFEELILRVVKLAYGHTAKPGDDYLSTIIRSEYLEAYGKPIGEMLGTMKSARSGKIRNHYEWMHETMTQYVMTGKVKMNLDVTALPHDPLTGDEYKMKKVKQLVVRFMTKIEKLFDQTLDEARGQIWMV